ncbi:MAG: hypothetical protein ACLFWB_05515 [Armatimonadota bacterium]
MRDWSEARSQRDGSKLLRHVPGVLLLVPWIRGRVADMNITGDED